MNQRLSQAATILCAQVTQVCVPASKGVICDRCYLGGYITAVIKTHTSIELTGVTRLQNESFVGLCVDKIKTHFCLLALYAYELFNL